MPIDPISAGAGVLTGLFGLAAGEDAEDAAHEQAQNIAMLEMAKFDKAVQQLEEFHKAGDEAAFQAYAESVRADIGAKRYEDLAMQFADKYANSAVAQAIRKEQEATALYNRIHDASKAKQAQGAESADSITNAGRNIIQAADRSGSLQQGSFDRTAARYTPFMESEKAALGQLGVELGLTDGEVNRSYRDSPAYMASMDASRVAEQDARDVIDTAAGNSGSLYSGTRGAALMDRANRGSYERAGIEQNYYNNYMTLLRDMANPTATSAVSSADMNTSANMGQNYMTAAGANSDAVRSAEAMRVGSMQTGAEGAELINFMRTGVEGAPYHLKALESLDMGTAGSPYRMTGQDYKFRSKSAGPGIAASAPNGVAAANTALMGTASKNAAYADVMGGLTNLYTAYMNPSNNTNQIPVFQAGNDAWDKFYGVA